MNTQPDFEELLRLFEENNVAYMIVGGYAVAFHGYPRFTKDIDILFQLDEDNIQRMKQALFAFGFAENALPARLFKERGNIIKFGIEPIRVDLLNEIDGVEFEKIADRAVRGRYGEVEVSFIGKEDLIANKQASGRSQDIADLEKLRG
jgi:predicted nucleotidyltransferase